MGIDAYTVNATRQAVARYRGFEVKKTAIEAAASQASQAPAPGPVAS
jgi:hypothetical protein